MSHPGILWYTVGAEIKHVFKLVQKNKSTIEKSEKYFFLVFELSALKFSLKKQNWSYFFTSLIITVFLIEFTARLSYETTVDSEGLFLNYSIRVYIFVDIFLID